MQVWLEKLERSRFPSQYKYAIASLLFLMLRSPVLANLLRCKSKDESMTENLNQEESLEIVRSLLQRQNLKNEAKQAFHQAYPTAPEEMLETAVFHTYVDGIGAAIDWLVDLELFLRDPEKHLDIGVTYHLLYHLYNWHQFYALLPDGKSGVLKRLREIKELIADGDTDAILLAIGELESMLEGSRNYPDFQ
ncbi:hypothetical protein H6F89_01880 [Cyanobacteria bacterium FACHB-63]|nr:hypothetical protein [Cyanobacteria bacterium FACHB-63]